MEAPGRDKPAPKSKLPQGGRTRHPFRDAGAVHRPAARALDGQRSGHPDTNTQIVVLRSDGFYATGLIAIKQLGEVAMSRINRRALLLHSGSAVVASSMTATALGAEPPSRDQEPSSYLRALIEAHKTAYTEFGKALHEIGGGSDDPARASREEERVLLAICGYPAVGEGDRLAKARYLLEIEARGELDLAEHTQAVLQSTMLKG
ncbi:hypothetical protein X766_17875 [Mesorhizobium sp. LSJC255A00]|nr:hypothetical protein X766_17875 [Mesorhizobium sp. LSJC255A00]